MMLPHRLPVVSLYILDRSDIEEDLASVMQAGKGW
jgi:hypothetical protein